jgi:hypothetical protein
MPMRLQVNHYCFNMMLCRWPPFRLIQSCTHYGKDVTTCSIALGVSWIPSGICCFKSWVLARDVSYTLLFMRPKGISLLLQDETSGQASWCPWCKKMSVPRTVSWEFASNLCCVSSCSKQCCAWWRSVWKHRSVSKLVFKFRLVLGVSGMPDSLIAWSWSTRLLVGAILKASYTEHIPPILIIFKTVNSRVYSFTP